MQRFVVGVANHPTNVLVHARNAANRTGRTFAITYDVSGEDLAEDYRWFGEVTRKEGA